MSGGERNGEEAYLKFCLRGEWPTRESGLIEKGVLIELSRYFVHTPFHTG